MSRVSTARGGRIRALPGGGPSHKAQERAEAGLLAPPRAEALEAMDRDALLSLWASTMNGEPPSRVSQPFLRRMLSWELQAREQGGLPASVERKLESLAIAQASGKERTPATPKLQPGGRLLREWGGVTHVVDVVEGGFLWRGERYRSLSSIGRAITGAHWSGPRFFGLQEPAGGAGAASTKISKDRHSKKVSPLPGKMSSKAAMPAPGPWGRSAA